METNCLFVKTMLPIIKVFLLLDLLPSYRKLYYLLTGSALKAGKREVGGFEPMSWSSTQRFSFCCCFLLSLSKYGSLKIPYWGHSSIPPISLAQIIGRIKTTTITTVISKSHIESFSMHDVVQRSKVL